MEFSVEFIGACCNLTYNCLELTENYLVYGSNHSVAVYDLHEKKVVKTYVKHAGRINCVRFILQSNNKLLVTCGSDGQLIIWHNSYDTTQIEDSVGKTSIPCLLEAELCHQSQPITPITVCNGISHEENKPIIGYITSLSSVVLGIADLEGGSFSPFQSIILHQTVALDILFETLPGDELMMALGLGSGEVALYGIPGDLKPGPDMPFTKICGLNKHEDWVRCLAITTLENGERLLATGGQDSFIAIWRFKNDETTAVMEDFEFQVVDFRNRKIVFDSMILGHEGWVNSLQWNSKGELISCSSDQTVIIWENIGQIWMEKTRLGVVGGQTLGGYCSRFDSQHVVTSGFQGAIQIWSWSVETEEWTIEASVTGHFKGVSDLDYDAEGRFIVTTSEDQTSRIFAPWGTDRWHEISRPQIHGHDLFALKCAGDYIVSGAEEKILRAFQPTEVFVANYKDTSGTPINLTNVSEAASVPALGLSNLTTSDHFDIIGKRLEERLEEDFLRSQTLWPETCKLYGHGYEICCIGASSSDPIIVSGCNSTKQQFAAIILWSTVNWKSLGEFPFHKLNVTDLEFSKNGQRLLSASRDRTWAVWKVLRSREAGEAFSLELQENNNAHSRALTVGTWCPNNDYFVTGGRDKKLMVWKAGNQEEMKDYGKVAVETFQQSVTAAAVNEDNMIAVGLESGIITVLQLTFGSESNAAQLTALLTLTNSDAHHGLVKRLKFNPKKKYQLASASADHAVKIYRFKP